MKLKTKAGLRFRTGKNINHCISVDDNTVLCASLAAAAVVTGKAVEGLTRVGLRMVDGMNERARAKLDYKLAHPKPKK